METTSIITKEEALKITNSAEKFDLEQTIGMLIRRGMDSKYVVTIRRIAATVVKVCGKVLAVGKAILSSIVEFMLKYPHLTIGVILGLLAAALLSTVPLVGAPLASFLTLPVVAIFGIQGLRQDLREQKGEDIGFLTTIIELFYQGIKLLIDIVKKAIALNKREVTNTATI